MSKIEFTRINNDTNGNPRYVCHFLNFLTQDEKWGKNQIPVEDSYQFALNRAKKIGGRKYHTKSYGGGIVFQSYNITATEMQINELLNESK